MTWGLRVTRVAATHRATLALSRTPCAFRLRQARTVSAAESDVPCRDDGAAPSVPLLGMARPEVPKHTRALCPSAEPSRQDRLYRAPVKVTRYARSRTPSIDSIPTLRPEVVEWVNDVSSDFHPTRTPRLTRRSRPPCHGLPGRRAALLRGPLARPTHSRGLILRALLGEDASRQSLQPTSCHEHSLDPSILEPGACTLPTERFQRRPVGARTGVRGTRQCRRRRRRLTA